MIKNETRELLEEMKFSFADPNKRTVEVDEFFQIDIAEEQTDETKERLRKLRIAAEENSIPLKSCINDASFDVMELVKQIEYAENVKEVPELENDDQTYTAPDDEGAPVLDPKLIYNQKYSLFISTGGIVWKDYQIKTKARGVKRTANNGKVHYEKVEDVGLLVPKPTIQNLKVLLDRIGLKLYFNELERKIETDPILPLSESNYLNDLITHVKNVAREYDLPVTEIPDQLEYIAGTPENSYHPVVKMLDETKWDGRNRFDKLFNTLTISEEYASEENIKLFKVLLRKWLWSCVAAARARNYETFATQGCLVLAGKQGTRKTTWLENLIPKQGRGFTGGWFLGGFVLATDKPDKVDAYASHWIVELAELDATFKKSDIESLKAFITQPKDVYRSPYARKANSYRRRTVPCATVNGDTFLKDDENRRWWVIPVSATNPYHDVDLPQLWAQMDVELATRYKNGKSTWWLTPQEQHALNCLNKDFKPEEKIINAFEKFFFKPGDGHFDDIKDENRKLKTMNIHEICEFMDYRNYNKQEANVLAGYLREQGYERKTANKKFVVGARTVRREEDTGRLIALPTDKEIKQNQNDHEAAKEAQTLLKIMGE